MLRLLFFVLLAFNLGLLAWHAWIAPERGEQTLRVEQPAEDRLVLVDAEDNDSELGADGPQPEDAREPAADDRAESDVDWRPAGCIVLGGLDTEEAVRELAARLGIRSPRIRTDVTTAVTGWWVILPPERVTDPGATSSALEAAGESDFFVIGTGEAAGGISLGLYSSPERARNRLREVRALGFDPVIREREEETARYWLNLPLGINLSPLGDMGGEVGIRPALCPAEPDALVTRPEEP